MISSTRLCLKPFISDDADECYACITPTLTTYMSWDPPEDQNAFESIWRTWLITIQDESDWVFVIRHQSNNEFLGLVGFHQTKHLRPELGIWIREDRHGFAYGKEAVTAIADWASRHFSFEAFIYPVAIENHASRRIAESLNGTPIYCSQQPKYKSITYLFPECKQNSNFVIENLALNMQLH